MARIRFRPDMTPELQNLMNLLYQRTEEQRKRQEMLNRLKSMTGLFGDTGSAYMSGIDLETGMPKVSFRSPEEQQAMIFQNRLKDYFAAKRLGQSMTGERYRTLTPEQKMQFIKARETYKTGLPEFRRRQFIQSESGKYKELAPTKISIATPEGLSSEQQLQARALSRKIYGVRGAEYGLPAVYEEMRKGKSIDQIEDELRFAGQSKQFSGAIRNAAQSILINTDINKAQNAMDYIDDKLSQGNIEGAKSQLKRLARAQSGVDDQRTIQGKERTIKLLDEIQDDLNTLEANGINTNIFSGTAEQIVAKVGMVKNPAMRKVATKIAAAVQNYRRSMTGVQFGMPENREYKIMFPTISRTANFNIANIDALREVMQGDLDNFYSLAMGEDNYKSLFGYGMRGKVGTQMTGDFISPRQDNKNITRTGIYKGRKVIQYSDGTIEYQ